MAINAHQVTAGKRLESHDEQLMLIIPVVGRYDTRWCRVCWLRTKPSWTVAHWALLDSLKKELCELLGF
jgi:hypothetical protein